ncbi:MAG: hypothetical protein ABEI07_00230, partial [Candidatus Nanohaloarchaea archaeon]
IEEAVPEGGGFPLIPVVVASLVVLVLGILAYMVIPGSEEAQKPSREESPRLKRLGFVRPSKEEEYRYEDMSVVGRLEKKLKGLLRKLRRAV